VLEAQARGVPGALLERCRLLWDRDKGHRAMLELQLALQQQLEAGERRPATAGCTWPPTHDRVAATRNLLLALECNVAERCNG